VKELKNCRRLRRVIEDHKKTTNKGLKGRLPKPSGENSVRKVVTYLEQTARKRKSFINKRKLKRGRVGCRMPGKKT